MYQKNQLVCLPLQNEDRERIPLLVDVPKKKKPRYLKPTYQVAST